MSDDSFVMVAVKKDDREFVGFYDGEGFVQERAQAKEFPRTGMVLLHETFAKSDAPEGCEILKVRADAEDFSGPYGKSWKDDARITPVRVFGE